MSEDDVAELRKGLEAALQKFLRQGEQADGAPNDQAGAGIGHLEGFRWALRAVLDCFNQNGIVADNVESDIAVANSVVEKAGRHGRSAVLGRVNGQLLASGGGRIGSKPRG
jgi:hypothetical protein